MRAPANAFTVPPALAGVLARLPAFPGAWLFSRALNLALSGELPADVKKALDGKHLRLQVADARLGFDFTWQRGAFCARSATGTPDLTIRACAHDLVRLARREEDPDTLFFSRRLALEGDTELGLLFKNTLDAIDASVFDPASLLRRRGR